MRELTEDESKLTKKGIERLKTEVSELLANLDYNKAVINLTVEQRKFEDKFREYKRNTKDKEDKKLIKQQEDYIREQQNTIITMAKQLQEGVEEKTPEGVK